MRRRSWRSLLFLKRSNSRNFWRATLNFSFRIRTFLSLGSALHTVPLTELVCLRFHLRRRPKWPIRRAESRDEGESNAQGVHNVIQPCRRTK